MHSQSKKPGFLAVGNYDSNVGYAWRLMESFWCSISSQLEPLGFQPHICFPSISIIPKCLSEAHFSAHTFDFTKRDILSIFAQSYFIWKNNIKLIYLTDFKTVDIGYFFYRVAGIKKIIIHDHAPGVRKVPGYLQLTIKKLLHRISWISADGCIAVSPYVEQRMLNVNGVMPEKVRCIVNGIPVDSYSPKRHENDQRIHIVTVARANYYKGIDFAVRTIAELLKRNQTTPITYTLFGDGPNLNDFKQLVAELNITDHVRFAGKVDGISEKLLDCDIAFHPSRGEAMSLAILEYMRAGLPTVASSNQSVSSFLLDNDTAVIYKENSLESATNAIEQLINSKELRKKIGNNAWLAVKNQFNDKLMYSNFNHYILEILSQNSNIHTYK